jgi:hypothetical protein
MVAAAVGPARPVGGEGAARACAVVGFEGPPLSSSPRLPVFPSSSPRLLRARQGGLYSLVNWAQEVGGLGAGGLCSGDQGGWLAGAWIPMSSFQSDARIRIALIGSKSRVLGVS